MPFDVNSNPVRIAIGAALLVIGLLLGWFGHKAASAPPDVVTTRQYDDWRVACPKSTDKGQSCGMQSEGELVQIAIFKPKNMTGTQMVLTVPFNVLLEPGIGLQFTTNAQFSAADKPKLYPFEACNQIGCIVRIPFDDALAQTIAGAKSARILVARLDGKDAALPFSLKGFADAHHALVVDEGRRHSWWKRLWS